VSDERSTIQQSCEAYLEEMTIRAVSEEEHKLGRSATQGTRCIEMKEIERLTQTLSRLCRSGT
jgi:hypothetical protein